MKKCVLLMITLLMLLLALPAMADVLDKPVKDGVVDLTGNKSLKDKQVNQMVKDLQAQPEVTRVELVGVSLNQNQRLRLMEKCPDVDFHWMVKIGGVEIDSDATVLDLDSLVKSSTKLSDIRNGLNCLPKVEKVIMFNFRFSLGAMEGLLEQFPDIDFSWTNHWYVCDGRVIDLRTDATAFTTAKGRQEPRYTADKLMRRLKHCPDLLAIDVGHNNVSDLSFLLNWPNLRRLIVIDSLRPITDLSPLAQLPDLEYIELFMQDITDISPLANHEKLLDLNLCCNDVTDLSPLYSCPNLERLQISFNPNLTQEEVDKLQAVLPNCEIITDAEDCTEGGWREHPRYFNIYESFNSYTYIPFEPITEESADAAPEEPAE